MNVVARVTNTHKQHEVELRTNERIHTIEIPAKADGNGSDANGGELLFLALATCYCNDLYREAAKQDIIVDWVEVTVEGEFGAPGEPARNVRYRARAESASDPQRLRDLLLHTDTVTEIQKTLRSGCDISFQLA